MRCTDLQSAGFRRTARVVTEVDGRLCGTTEKPYLQARGTAAKLAQSGVADLAAVSMNVEKRRELAVFVFLTLVLAPLIAVLVVAGYGFVVWMYQMIAGPPTV